MSGWEDEALNEEVQAFIEFDERRHGARFQFGYVRGATPTITAEKKRDRMRVANSPGTEKTVQTGHRRTVLDGQILKAVKLNRNALHPPGRRFGVRGEEGQGTVNRSESGVNDGRIGRSPSASPMAEFWPHRKVRGCFRPVTPLSCGSKRFRLAAQKQASATIAKPLNVVEP